MTQRNGREPEVSSLPDPAEIGIVSVALDGTIQKWGGGAQDLYGYPATEMMGQPLKRLLPVQDWPLLEELLLQAAEGNIPSCEIAERLHRNGSRILLSIKRAVIHKEGKVHGVLELARFIGSPDVGPRREASLKMLVEQLPVFLWTTDRNLTITSNWGSGLPSLKVHSKTLVGSSICEFLECADRHCRPIAEHYDALRGLSSQFEYEWRDRFLQIHLGPLRTEDGNLIGCIGVATDITDRKKNEEQILHQARHDALTGLANYREFMDRLEQEVRRSNRGRDFFTLLLLDLDELKRINDLHGHLAGNRALKRLSAAMREHCRSTDVAARYGGDEFAVILIDSDRGMAEHVARRIEMHLRTDQEKPALSASIGIGVYPDDGRSAAELIEAADRRLYQRKKNQNSQAFSIP